MALEAGFLTHPVALALNPAAGFHAIPEDAGEVEASRRAGAEALERFPYFVRRYGARGTQFCTSDTAWLVTLCDGDADHAVRQVLWLAGVLAARGMPRWLLERHLEILHAELVRSFPGRSARYGVLLAPVARLRELRTAAIAERDFGALAATFARRAEAAGTVLPAMGEILVAAVADEADGLDRAVESVEPWATDPARFPPAWTRAVRETLAAARERVRRPAAGGW